MKLYFSVLNIVLITMMI